MRFTVLSFVLQMPHLDLVAEAEKLKQSSLNASEKKSLDERSHYVKQWLDQLAPDDYKYTVLDASPDDLNLDEEQKSTLTKVKEVLSDESLPWEGAKIHEAIHKAKEEVGISPRKLFQPLYQIFLGRNSGPQVGWFLSTFKRSDVTNKLELKIKN